MKNINPLGLFDNHFQLEKLSKLKDPLEKLNKYINWKIFEAKLNEVFSGLNKDMSKGGRPAFNRLMMFKAFVIQSYYNLSDDQLEYQILDRASFKRFLGLKNSDRVPDSKTFWLFRDQLMKSGVLDELWQSFLTALDNAGVLGSAGKIVDASFVEAPRQRNNKDDNDHIKKTGQAPEEWENNPNKLAQKDIDARWTIKNGERHYGYKDHIVADAKTKLITGYVVTNASVHDSQVIGQLITEKEAGQDLYGDSAYKGEPQDKIYREKNVMPKINEKGYRNKPLTDEQKSNNRAKSKIRARVEHVFGFIENSMRGSFIRTIGMKRAKVKICLMNLTYNLFRLVQLNLKLNENWLIEG
jgi:IS5 family transposase